MKKTLLALSLISLPLAAASRDELIAALKLYCATRLQMGKPVEKAFFYLKLKEAALKQLNPYTISQGITGIAKLDELNRTFHGYIVDGSQEKLGLAFENRRALLPQLAAIYRQEGAQLWDVEISETTRSRAINQIKVVLSARGTKAHQKFKRSAEYSPTKTGIKPLDTLNYDYQATISEIFWNSAGNATFVLNFKNSIKDRDLAHYAELVGDESDIASAEIHTNPFGE